MPTWKKLSFFPRAFLCIFIIIRKESELRDLKRDHFSVHEFSRACIRKFRPAT